VIGGHASLTSLGGTVIFNKKKMEKKISGKGESARKRALQTSLGEHLPRGPGEIGPLGNRLGTRGARFSRIPLRDFDKRIPCDEARG